MFYPCDYEVKINKEREIQERIQQAATDNLARTLRPHHPGMLQRLARAMAHGLGHLLLSIGNGLDNGDNRNSTRVPQRPASAYKN